MDLTLLVNFLAPFLPHLLNLGKTATQKATESAAGKFGEAAWTQAQTLWSKLWPQLKTKPAAQEAVTDLAQDPGDRDLQTVLQVQLKKLFAQDHALAAEIAQIMAANPPSPAIVQTVTGDQNQVIGQNFGTAVGNYEQPRKRTIVPAREVGNVDLEIIKATVKGVHVVPDDQGWQVQKSGPERIQIHFESKQKAEEFARELGDREQVNVFIHTEEGLRRTREGLQRVWGQS